MPSLSIRPRVDETGGFAALKGADLTKVVHVTDAIEVGSLTGGMASGKPSVAICVPLPERGALIVETSLELFAAAARALTAAHE